MTLERQFVRVTDGPPSDLIFDAAKYAPSPVWRTPILLTIGNGIGCVELNYVNAPTWMGHGSRILSFTGWAREPKIYIRVMNYDTQARTGDAEVSSSPLPGTP